MNQKLVIDGCIVGTVKRYYQNRDRQSWIFVLDTYDTANEKYQLQVEIKFSAIKSFFNIGMTENGCGQLRITTWEGAT